MADFRLGVDFGTSTTVACLRWPDGRTRPLLFDGSPLLPSAVYLDDGRLLVGRDALHSARVQPAQFEPNPKQRIDDGAVLLGAVEVPVSDLIAAVLRRVVVEASSVTAGEPFDVTLAYPAAWGEHRRRTLVNASIAAGMVEPWLVAEPIAAASYFEAVVRDRDRPAGAIVVYDLGAGTFDVSVVTRGATGFEVRVADGLADIGGLDIDAAIIGFLGALSGDDESVWSRLEQPVTAPDLRARRQLWDDVRTAKEMLSRSSSTIIYVPLVERDVPLGRAQFERLVRPLLERTVATTKSAIRRADLAPRTTLDVFLVGGASRVPLIATLLHRALEVPPTAIEQPELAVAEGCLASGGLTEPDGNGVAHAYGPVAAAPVSGDGNAGPGGVGPGGTGPGGTGPGGVGPGGTGGSGAGGTGGFGPGGPRPPLVSGPTVGPPARPTGHPEWTRLVQVLDLAVGRSAGFTLRCYLPADDPDEDPDAVFLTSDRRLLVFDELPHLVRHVRSTTAHDLAGLTDWHLVSSGIDAASAEHYTVEAYELDLILANLAHGTREWSPDLFVAARDLAVELANALDLRAVLKSFSRGSLLDNLDDTMRMHVARHTSRWWKDMRLTPFEVNAVRETWHRTSTMIEAAIWS